MNERHYTILEIDFIRDQYNGFTKNNPDTGFVEYIKDVYDNSTMQKNFEKTYGYLKKGLLESVIDGE